MLGQKIRQYTSTETSTGSPVQIVWDATNEQGDYIASGIFFIRADIISDVGKLQTSALTKVIYLK
jgi:hypothetical protein